MSIDAGPRDRRSVQSTPNYGLIYRSRRLDRDLAIAGAIRMISHVQSSCPDTDFVAKLIELAPDGRATLSMDGVTRAMYRGPSGEPLHLIPGQVERLTVHFGDIYYTFRAGYRIEVDLTSGNFPRRARNNDSSHAILVADDDDDICIAINTIHHDEPTPSFVELPMLTGR